MTEVPATAGRAASHRHDVTETSRRPLTRSARFVPPTFHQDRGEAPRAGRLDLLLSSGIERYERAQSATCATGAAPAASAPASASSCPRTRAPSGLLGLSPRESPAHAAGSAVRRSSGTRLRQSKLPKKTPTSGVQCWPVCTTTSSMPASRSASGASLIENWDRADYRENAHGTRHNARRLRP